LPRSEANTQIETFSDAKVEHTLWPDSVPGMTDWVTVGIKRGSVKCEFIALNTEPLLLFAIVSLTHYS